MKNLDKKEVIIYFTWTNGKKDVRYRRVFGSPEANVLIDEVEALKKKLGDNRPYSYELK